MNRKQWIGIYTAAALILIAIFLHGPWSGYETTWSYFSSILNQGVSGDLAFLDWYSRSPLVPWLGVIKNLLASVGLIFALTIIWILANRK